MGHLRYFNALFRMTKCTKIDIFYNKNLDWIRNVAGGVRTSLLKKKFLHTFFKNGHKGTKEFWNHEKVLASFSLITIIIISIQKKYMNESLVILTF